MLLSRKEEAYTERFVEQDLLNAVYESSWKELSETFNHMHIYRHKSVEKEITAIHEKVDVLQERFPNSQYIWNTKQNQDST